jgi:hypothetical protein
MLKFFEVLKIKFQMKFNRIRFPNKTSYNLMEFLNITPVD